MDDSNKKNKILDILLRKYVKIETKEIVESLYLSMKDIKELINYKMYVGGHGYNHLRLGSLNNKEQEKK